MYTYKIPVQLQLCYTEKRPSPWWT